MTGWLLLIGVLLALVNTVSFFLFCGDKVFAVFHWVRVPESRLLLSAVFGPLGAYAGMRLARHKIRNPRFVLVPACLAVQVVGVLVIFFVFGSKW